MWHRARLNIHESLTTDTMYYLREGSHKSADPLFTKIPVASNNVRDHLAMFFPERSVAQWFFDAGMAEKPLITWVYDTLVKEDKVFVDIGAHVGTYSWTCGKKAAHTYAFECSPRTFCYLAANVALHDMTDRISPYPYALGDKEGTIDYIVRSDDGGGNGVKELCAGDAGCKKIAIPMKTLDSFGLTNIGLIKMDVEGFEKEVLMGAHETLKASGYPKILFECWGDWKNAEGVDATGIRRELFAYLEGMGYKIVSVSGAKDMYLAEIPTIRV
jgi:FkbM family methyltransferase